MRLRSVTRPLNPTEKARLLVDRSSSLPIDQQCELVGIARSTFYYKPVSRADDETIRQEVLRINEKYPFYGYRRIFQLLKRSGYQVGEYRLRRIMSELGIKAIYPKPNLSKPCKEHKVYPYLLRNLDINEVNQVWATDITYIRFEKSFMYLTAVLDLHSRKVLSWELSNSYETAFCIQSLQDALWKYDKPEIFNTDQGAQYTSKEFTQVLLNNDIQISMDGKGRALDNVFVERLWRTIKYEEVYLKEYKDVKELRAALAEYFEFYNNERFHMSLDWKTPNEKYAEGLNKKQRKAG